MSLLEIISQCTNWSTVALIAAVCLVIYAYLHDFRMPPGPMGLPYVGYYPFFSEDCCLELHRMTEKYGKVFCFTVTGQLYVHVSNLKTIREISVTKSDCFDQKSANFTLLRDIFEGGVFLLNGEEWKVLRKFFILKFKEFGKKTQDEIIHHCLKKIVSSLSKSSGNEFRALDFFWDNANDVIRHLIFGNVKLDENDIQRFNESYVRATEFSTVKKTLLAGPILKYILMPFVSEYQNYRKNMKQVHAIMCKFVQQHEKEFDQTNIRNLVDAYINERKVLEETNDPKAKFFTERGLVSSLLQFFGDGTLAVGWLIASVLQNLSLYPDVQKAIQSEIDEVIGRNRLPSLDDKRKLTYTNAAIYEGVRMVKFFPLLPSVECTKETTLEGCRIPKSTIVVYNIWPALRDVELYDEPDRFDPTRFLSIDGEKPRCEIPFIFGAGKRSCIGESLSNMQLLLYVTTVFQHFDLHPVKEHKTPPEEWNIYINATPRAL